MTIEDIVKSLQIEAARIAEDIPDAVWYLFGSVLRDAAVAADIDVLILYSADADALVIRDKLAKLCLLLPLHLFLVSRQEERELNFIATQGCRQIYP